MNKIYFLITIFLNKIILKIWFLSLLFHLHFLSFCLSPANPHNTIHQNSTTFFYHHQNYPKKKKKKKTHIPELPPPSPVKSQKNMMLKKCSRNMPALRNCSSKRCRLPQPVLRPQLKAKLTVSFRAL